MTARIGFITWARLIGILMLLFTAAWAAPEQPAKRIPSRIRYWDNAFYPPFSMTDSKGVPMGFNIDLIRAIGREVGIQVEVRLLPWAQVRSAFDTEHTVDVSAMFCSAERDRVFDFSTPLATEVYQIFMRHGTQGMDSLDALSGKQVLVEDRSYAAEYVSANHPDIRLISVRSEPEALRLLSSGKADAALASQSGGFYCIAQADLKNLVPADLPVMPVTYSFAVPDGHQVLLDEINRGCPVSNEVVNIQGFTANGSDLSHQASREGFHRGT